jgi:hypothetical protein
MGEERGAEGRDALMLEKVLREGDSDGCSEMDLFEKAICAGILMVEAKTRLKFVIQ